MSKKTTGKIVLTLAVLLAAGSVTAAAGKAAAVQCNGSSFQDSNAEKLLICETSYDDIEENNYA